MTEGHHSVSVCVIELMCEGLTERPVILHTFQQGSEAECMCLAPATL